MKDEAISRYGPVEIANEREKRQKEWMTEREGKRGEVCIDKIL
jgi:hypothetical protein